MYEMCSTNKVDWNKVSAGLTRLHLHPRPPLPEVTQINNEIKKISLSIYKYMYTVYVKKSINT